MNWIEFKRLSVKFIELDGWMFDYILELLQACTKPSVSPSTHWGRVMQICAVNWPASSHHLNQCWNITCWTLGNNLQWGINRNSYIFIQENTFETVVWKMAAILPRPQCELMFQVSSEQRDSPRRGWWHGIGALRALCPYPSPGDYEHVLAGIVLCMHPAN